MRAVWAAVLLAGLVAACFPSEGPAGVYVTNDLDRPVRMTYVVNGTETPLGDELHGDRIVPGEQVEFVLDLYDKGNKSVCSTGDLVARTDDGAEVARIPPPLCAGGIPRLSSFVGTTPR